MFPQLQAQQYKPIPLVFPSLDPADYDTTNVTQGATFQQNLTVLSRAEIQLQIPLSLKLTGSNNSAYTSSTPQDRIFNYTFNPNLLVINPDESRCAILTVEVANDAPLGLYVLKVELGNASLTHLSGCTFSVTVTTSQVDTLWIAEVDQFLEEAKPYSEWKQEYTLVDLTLTLFENGTNQFVGAEGVGLVINNFTEYLQSLLLKVNMQMNPQTDNSSLQKILNADRSVELYSRLGSLPLGTSNVHYRYALFVLEDYLKLGLKGTIMVEDLNGTKSWWGITK